VKILFACFILFSSAFCTDGKIVFEKYCWGCHHQTSLAFGPSFKEIANHRTNGEIIAHINKPENSYKNLGYKRTVMPAFELTSDEYEAISTYILSFKSNKKD
jgi:cytochrome c